MQQSETQFDASLDSVILNNVNLLEPWFLNVNSNDYQWNR